MGMPQADIPKSALQYTHKTACEWSKQRRNADSRSPVSANIRTYCIRNVTAGCVKLLGVKIHFVFIAVGGAMSIYALHFRPTFYNFGLKYN